MEITSPQGDRKIGARPHKPEIAVNIVNEEGTGHEACPLFIKIIPRTAAGNRASR